MRTLRFVRGAVGVVFLLRTTPALHALGVGWAPARMLGWPDGTWKLAAVAIPPSLVIALVILRTAGAVLFTAGVVTRWAGLVAALAGWVLLANDLTAFLNSLHLLYCATACIALATRFSTKDRRLVLRALPLSVYAFSGLAKLNASFLSGSVLRALHDEGTLRGRIADTVTATATRAQGASILVVATELALGPLLFFRATRRIGVAVALAFHVVMEVAIGPAVFGWVMVALLLALVE